MLIRVVCAVALVLGFASRLEAQESWQAMPAQFDSLVHVQAVTPQFIVITSLNNEMARSTDGGETWLTLDLNLPQLFSRDSPYVMALRKSPYTRGLAFHFLDTAFGVAGTAFETIGSRGKSISNDGAFRTTTDGGLTWNRGFLTTHNPRLPMWFKMFNREWGMVGLHGPASRSINGDTITDYFGYGGLGWTDDSSNGWWDFYYGGGRESFCPVNAIHFRNDGRGLASIDSHHVFLRALLRYAVGNRRDQFVTSIGPRYRFDAIGSTTGRWFASHAQELFTSVDDTTWQFMTEMTSPIRCITFVDDSLGYLATDQGLYITHNGGMKWDWTHDGRFLEVSHVGDVTFAITADGIYKRRDISRVTILPSPGKLSIFPNPSRKTFTAQSSTPISEWCLTDTRGVEVIRAKLDTPSNEWTIDAGSLPNGTYLLTAGPTSSRLIVR